MLGRSKLLLCLLYARSTITAESCPVWNSAHHRYKTHPRAEFHDEKWSCLARRSTCCYGAPNLPDIRNLWIPGSSPKSREKNETYGSFGGIRTCAFSRRPILPPLRRASVPGVDLGSHWGPFVVDAGSIWGRASALLRPEMSNSPSPAGPITEAVMHAARRARGPDPARRRAGSANAGGLGPSSPCARGTPWPCRPGAEAAPQAGAALATAGLAPPLTLC